MNSYNFSQSELLMQPSRKFVMTLFAGLAFFAGSFPGAALANDGAHVQITQAQAEKTALAKVPGGKVTAAKLAPENGEMIWSIDIITPLTKKVVAVEVDAETGKVLSKLKENPGDRAEDTAPSRKKD
jgi:hypothetical protein